MERNHLFFSSLILLIVGILLSACNASLNSNVLIPSPVNPIPTSVSTPAGEATDEELMNQLNSDSSVNIDAQFEELEKE